MAAALRNVAARLGGGAVLKAANVPGRLPARLRRTRALTEEETKDAVFRHKYILAMKEELFNEMVHFRQKYYISKLHSWNSEMLLYPLSLGLKPRPGDTFRKNYQRKEITNRVFWLVGVFATIDMVAKGLGWCIVKAVKPEGKEQLEKKENMMVSAAGV